MGYKVKITDTTLRDAHQSLWATRMRTEEMLPVINQIDNMGYHSLEVWGGATFDVCLRFLNEDPWQRLRTLKANCKKTPLQMLLRGQNILGYQHYPDDVVEAFVHKSVENGIDIIRIFDALNDVRNMEKSIKATKEAGGHVQASVVYTVSPVHTTDHYLDTALRLADMGADSICIKDMAGLLAPYKAYELVTKFKEQLGLPIQLHSHYVGGLAIATYLKAIDAGVDIIDTASGPLAFGSSQPPVETVVRALQSTGYDPEIDLHNLFDVASYFEELRKRDGYERGVTRIQDMKVFDHQVPGGMISNLVSQLQEQKALDKLPEVLAEIPKVRKELGYPPLVTPTSQIVGIQAVLNVLLGRYKMVPGEVKAYCQGYYGKPPADIDPEIQKKVVGDAEIITCRPADVLEPKLDKLRDEIKDLAKCEEDVLSYALFPPIAKKFFEYRSTAGREEESIKIKAEANDVEEDSSMNLKEIKELIKMIDDTDISELNLESEGVRVNIRKGGVAPSMVPAPSVATGQVVTESKVEEPKTVAVEEKAPAKAGANIVEVVAPMVGTFYAAPAPDAAPFVALGDTVKAGQTVCIVEAMKLMNEIEAEVDGKIVEILVENAQPVEYGQPLFLIEKQ